MLSNEMNQMLADGGVMQEGGTVDPVSGNDVPAGAMKEEVRDDINAKLSEGEFVMPADVVRYIGLDTLMKLRDKAKAGLKRMEDIGQMGNAEEVDNAEALHGEKEGMDDDTFSSEIDSIMGEGDGGEKQEYAKGGYVAPTSAQIMGNPAEQEALHTTGGYTNPANQQRYTNAPIKGFEMVPVVNASGQTIYIPFINGVPQLAIPSGYKVKTVDDVATPVSGAGAGGATGGAGAGGGTGGGGAANGSDSNSGGSSGSNAAGGAPGSGNISMDVNGTAVANTVNSTVAGIVGAVLGTVMGVSPTIGFQGGKALAQNINFNAEQAAMNVNVATADTMGVNADTTSPAATTGPNGTGGAAATAGAAAAAAAADAGASPAAQGAASQAAADAAIGGASAADAAAVGATAAATASDSVSSESVEGGGAAPGAAPGDAPSDGSGNGGTTGSDTGADGTDGGGDGGDGGDGGYAKGGFISKKPKPTATKKGLAARRK